MRPVPITPRGERTAIGGRLRALRQARRMTIEQLAETTGLSKGFISRVERDLTSPSVATLLQLCEVLNAEVGDLFREPDSQFVAAGKAAPINLGGTDVVERLLTPRSERRLQVIRSVVPAGAHGTGGQEPYTINTEVETLHVVEGVVAFRLNNGTWELREGDSITFSGREPHTWEVLDPGADTVLLWVLVPAPWSSGR